jgi:phthalate 4,5-dioxygenase oxygenase subunit
MISVEQNDRLTRVGGDTPAGQLLRRYWQPAALTEELAGPRPVKPVTLLGEKLVIFRKVDGSYGLIGRHCPHRGADLSVGRLEPDGLRCVFHGWLYNEHGICLERPAEKRISTNGEPRQTAYPCVERNGIVFAYLGPDAPPPLPNFDCFVAPASHSFAFKGLWECNWLQAQEVGIDPAHASYLHRFLEDEDPDDAYGKQFRGAAADAAVPLTKILREFPAPDIRMEETDYGIRLTSLRVLDETSTHVRVTNGIFPNAICIPMSNEMTITQWHVPVDDETCYWYSIFTSYGAAVDQQKMRDQRVEMIELPDYVSKRNRSNNYGYDPTEQVSATYTGMGFDINVHDQWAVESLGRIQDRTQEHLGQTDVGIVRNRRMMLKAMDVIETGEGKLPMAGLEQDLRGPVAIDEIAVNTDWQMAWVARDRRRRQACAWPADQGFSYDE